MLKKLFIILLLLSSITSVYASGFQWSRLYHTRLNTFVRTTKLPHWQYVIGVYSTGNTITEYTEPTPEVVTNTVTVTKEVVKEVPVEKIVTIEKQLPPGTITISPEEKNTLRTRCYDNWSGWNAVCVDEFLYSKSIK